MASSKSQRGIEDSLIGATLESSTLPRGTVAVAEHAGESDPKPSTSQPAQVSVDQAPLEQTIASDRYESLAVLGEGGMGEVRLCLDRRIGREVALKVIKPGSGTRSSRERFEREARVQGQLEHPAVVPVYDLGIEADGKAYFTMKRVRGHSLADIIVGQREGDPAFVHEYTQRRLLQAIGDVCLAIAYAHARGVVHRDLKPGNIMLGSFGEVHVLDWGVAKVGTATTLAADIVPEAAVSAPTSDATRAGDLLGTPGYMAPEQVRAAPDLVDERADIYALGVILFEVLTLKPIHAEPNVRAVLLETMKGVDARASVRAKDRNVAPELEAICVKATALDPDDRFPSARAMHAAIERFLAGDRDLERRKQMASAHAHASKAKLDLARGGDERGQTARQEAMQEASAALALDPDNVLARSVLVELLVTPQTEMPASLRPEYLASRAPLDRAERKRTVYLFAVWAVFAPLSLFVGVRSLTAFFLAAGGLAVALILSIVSLKPDLQPKLRILTHAMGCFVVGVVSLVVGPLILAPGMAATLSHAFAQQNGAKFRVAGLTLGAAAILVPLALEMFGVLPPSYAFHDGVMVVLPRAVELTERGIVLFLGLASVNLIVAPAIYIARLRERTAVAEERIFLQAWNLRQLVPAAARDKLG